MAQRLAASDPGFEVKFAALRALAPAAIRLAEAEGLDAHARSVSIRLDL